VHAHCQVGLGAVWLLLIRLHKVQWLSEVGYSFQGHVEKQF
jgi:hypothetical protein